MKKFLVGVGNVKLFDGSKMIANAKTLMDSGIEVTTSSTEIRGGKGNALQAIYYHTSNLSINLTETQWNMDMVGQNVGSTLTAISATTSSAPTGSTWQSRSVTAGASTFNFDTIPVPAKIGGAQKFYWDDAGTVHSFAYNSSSISTTADDGTTVPNGTTVCLMYLTYGAGDMITVSSNFTPSRVHAQIEADLSGDITGGGVIGHVLIDVPVLQLSGAQTISMTADGYSNTPLTGNAIVTDDTTGSCSEGGYYAKIYETLTSASDWYSDVTALAIEGGDFSMVKGTSKTLRVFYMKSNGVAGIADNSALTFTITIPSTGGATSTTVGANTGIVSAGNTAGSASIKAKITAKTTIEANCDLTVTNS